MRTAFAAMITFNSSITSSYLVNGFEVAEMLAAPLGSVFTGHWLFSPLATFSAVGDEEVFQ